MGYGRLYQDTTRKYSLGMKQRLVIGLYLVSDAKYLIMDEITNWLDEDNRKHFFQQILNLKKQGKTILLSSHYKDEIVAYCDTVLQIHERTLVEVTSWIMLLYYLRRTLSAFWIFCLLFWFYHLSHCCIMEIQTL